MIRLLTTFSCLAAALSAQDRVELPKPRDPAPTVRVLPVGKLAVNPHRRDDNPRATLTEIAKFASRFVQPPLRGTEEIKSIGAQTLVGLLRPRQHAWLKGFVAGNRKVQGKMIDMRCRFVHLTEGAYIRLAKPLFKGRNKDYVELQDTPKTRKYIDNLPNFKGVNLITAPRLLALPSQRTKMTVVNQTSYWKDFEAEFDDKGNVTGAKPIPGVAKDGMWLDSISGFVEKGVIGISVHAKWSDLKRPIKEVGLRVKGVAKPLKIGVPEIDVAEIKTDVKMKSGNTVVFQLPSSKIGRLFIFITAAEIDPNQPPRK